MALRRPVSSQPTRVIFVMSSWHSGSTWIGYVLGSTARSAFVGEFHRPWHVSTAVPCTLCASRGLSACTVLDGVAAAPPTAAFAVAAGRLPGRVLVDNSKLVEWTRLFIGRDDVECRIVHAVKDPRGWLASVRRRATVPLAAGLAHWVGENRVFRDFSLNNAIPTLTVAYDRLALAPRWRFRPVFSFCGIPYDAAALRYWEHEHHGFAANGASAAILGGVAPAHYRTGDEAFYRTHRRTQFRDDRWRRELTADEDAAIRADGPTRELLASLGFRLSGSGMTASSRWRAVRG